MQEVETTHNTVSTRRRFLAQAAVAAAGGGALGMTLPLPTEAEVIEPDPIFEIIEADRRARKAHLASLAEVSRLHALGRRDVSHLSEGPCHAQADAWDRVTETAPISKAGLAAWVAYLDETGRSDEWDWLFEDVGTTMVATLAKALSNLS